MRESAWCCEDERPARTIPPPSTAKMMHFGSFFHCFSSVLVLSVQFWAGDSILFREQDGRRAAAQERDYHSVCGWFLQARHASVESEYSESSSVQPALQSHTHTQSYTHTHSWLWLCWVVEVFTSIIRVTWHTWIDVCNNLNPCRQWRTLVAYMRSTIPAVV